MFGRAGVGRLRAALGWAPGRSNGAQSATEAYEDPRIDRYMRSTDPAFEAKGAHIIGLYVNPPQHAAGFCLDEKTAIHALDRLDPVLPLSPGRAVRRASSITRTAPCRCRRRSTRPPARWSARRRPGVWARKRVGQR